MNPAAPRASRAALLVLLAALPALAAPLVIDDFEYDAARARATWQPQDRTPPVDVLPRPVEAQRSALRIACPFTRPVDRSFVDRAVRLDLTFCTALTVDLLVEEPDALARFTVYLRSGTGWYCGDFRDLRKGWQTLSLPRASFRAEGRPAGWGRIDTVRLSFWKSADIDTHAAVDRLQAVVDPEAPIVVVCGSNAIARGLPESRTAETTAATMSRLLADLGLRAALLDEADLPRGALSRARVALLPFNPALGKPEFDALAAFERRGGRVFAFYVHSAPLCELLGIQNVRWTRQEYAGQFAEIRFHAADVPGLPDRVRQNSWNINVVRPAARNARVIATWYDDAGRSTTFPALVLSDAGAYMSHVLLDDDPRGKRRMLLALLGRFVPGAWADASRAALDAVARVGGAATLEELQALVAARSRGSDRAPEAQRCILQAQALRARAEEALRADAFLNAVDLAESARASATRGWLLSHRPRPGEFRAVWNHSGTGALDTWQASVAVLAAAHFNAVVPNMWSAGAAHYDSRLLPHSDTFARKGDQIAQCVAAARRHGIEVHPWKVNWRLLGAPKAFLDRMTREGRTQVDASGKPIDWLCPSDPENFRMELETMLEVARNYDVDGLHFDYIRYPDSNACYCAGCRARFQKDTGNVVRRWPADAYEGHLRAAYRAWRCEQITRLVRAVAEQARRLKPHLTISAAVFSDYPACRDSIGQDWVEWVRRGYVDFVCPMDYIAEDAAFERTVARQVAQVAGAVPLYAGIGVAVERPLSPEQALRQMELARAAGADGFILFDYSPALARADIPALGEALAPSAFAPPHRSPDVSFEFPDAAEATGVLRLAAGRPVRVVVGVRSLGRRRDAADLSAVPAQAEGFSGAIEIQDAAGFAVRELGPCLPPPRRAEVSFTAPKGTWRLAVRGEVHFAGGGALPFITRSRPIVVADAP